MIDSASNRSIRIDWNLLHKPRKLTDILKICIEEKKNPISKDITKKVVIIHLFLIVSLTVLLFLALKKVIRMWWRWYLVTDGKWNQQNKFSISKHPVNVLNIHNIRYSVRCKKFSSLHSSRSNSPFPLLVLLAPSSSFFAASLILLSSSSILELKI